MMIKVIQVCLNHQTQAVFLGRNKKRKHPDETNKEEKIRSSIEGTKQTSVCVTPHTLGLTPPTYKNKQDYKGVTNDKTHNYHTHESGVSRSDDASLARNLDSEKKNTEEDEYIDHPSIKNDIIYSQ